MDLAILFCFYKEPELCENRLKILKRYNPDLKIYGLYGGERKSAEEYQKKLSGYLDNFYVSPFDDAHWKWLNFDMQIFDWYESVGKNLNWESIFVVQWDMLVFDSLKRQFESLGKDQIFLSGLRMLDKELESKWNWTEPNSEYRPQYLKFLDYIKENYGFNERPFCCFFVFLVFPRIFFEKYRDVSNKELGILEYKIPTYAVIFKIPLFKKDFGVKWFEKDEKPINSGFGEISEEYIKRELAKEDGWRIFHPYFRIWENKNI